MLTAFLELHGFTALDLERVFGTPEPTRRQVSMLELFVAKELLEAAGYTVVVRRSPEGGA
jgi:hypothetical protein